ncbi:MAG TPA: RNA polymerase sigma factor [Steroidobacteraceae bacterium]|nr:RNA polymerase sigma factor [Steroidobacteraceae bacterium]
MKSEFVGVAAAAAQGWADASRGTAGFASAAGRDIGADTATEGHALRRAQAGELRAFGELMRAHQGAIFSLALRMLRVREDAQELAQDVFLLLHRHLPGITSTAHLRHWLRRTVCHRAIDRLRSRPRQWGTPLEAVALQEAESEHGDPLLERHLRRLVGELSPIARAVMLLRYQEDLDPPDIAELLALPLNTVKSHLRRSLALLRERCDLQSPGAESNGR